MLDLEKQNKFLHKVTLTGKINALDVAANLFERTADVGFLSTDDLICTFLTTQDIQKEKLSQHLQEYANKYSVYNEIVIFDTQGNVKINMNQDNKILHSNDSILKDALQSESYIERYSHSDIFDAQEKTLIYAQKISYNNTDIGVLCLCFKFEDELSNILSNLAVDNESLSISDSSEIFATNKPGEHIAYSEKKYTILKQKSIVVTKKNIWLSRLLWD